ncbi:uncharacterized protein LOC34618951, partial [Cyclospora cayetanensis]|uniref:Uncharacterized protein LOC34618951 n=1 Tax=Cyclospora cayetanensis TaxID=88456 RepID=A0A6P6RYK9_9EIME
SPLPCTCAAGATAGASHCATATSWGARALVFTAPLPPTFCCGRTRPLHFSAAADGRHATSVASLAFCGSVAPTGGVQLSEGRPPSFLTLLSAAADSEATAAARLSRNPSAPALAVGSFSAAGDSSAAYPALAPTTPPDSPRHSKRPEETPSNSESLEFSRSDKTADSGAARDTAQEEKGDETFAAPAAPDLSLGSDGSQNCLSATALGLETVEDSGAFRKAFTRPRKPHGNLILELLHRAAAPLQEQQREERTLRECFALDNLADLLELLSYALDYRARLLQHQAAAAAARQQQQHQQHQLNDWQGKQQPLRGRGSPRSNGPQAPSASERDAEICFFSSLDNAELVTEDPRSDFDSWPWAACRNSQEWMLQQRQQQIAEEEHQEAGPLLARNKLSLFDICVESKLFAKDGMLACSFFARLRRLIEGESVPVGSAAPTGGLVLANEVLRSNTLSPLVFVAPELGKWSTVGGLGVMVDELSTTLATAVAASPARHGTRGSFRVSSIAVRGERGYLEKDGISHAFNVEVHVGGEFIKLGIHRGCVVKKVQLYFIHHASIFPQPYPEFYGVDAIRMLVTFAKGALELLCHERIIPQLIVTNDWPTSLIPAYAKNGFFGSTFENTTFFHIIHNLDPNYEGRIYMNKREDVHWLHQLPTELLVDPLWHNHVVNPSRCVLLQCDTWGTVSPSYRSELLQEGEGRAQNSPLAPLLRRHSNPFAVPNGIPIQRRLDAIAALGFKDHYEAKAALQREYFGMQHGDDSIPIFAFIGRITQQKGVHLILEAAETLITKHRGRVQLLLGGMANWKDGYAARCASKMMELRWKYPQSFWADPNEFFTKGAHVNYGADFGLMPSAFEPGGIVQHEFFISGTPVIAFHTGGLKDTVVEFVPSTGKGNGFCFMSYTSGDLLYAIERAIRVFDDKEKYALLRRLARQSVVSCEASSWAWLCEFARLRNKMPINENKVQQIYNSLPEWSEGAWRKRKEQLAAAAVGVSSPTGCGWGKLMSQDPEKQHLLLQKQAEAAAEFWELPSSTASKRRRSRAKQHEHTSSSSSTSEGETTLSPESASRSSSRRSSTEEKASHKAASHKPTAHKKLLPSTIRYIPPQGKPRPRSVAVAGSFDDWRVRRPLAWDNAVQAFAISLALPPGEYTYKLVVDGEWVCCHGSPTALDTGGNENNILTVE